MVRVTTAIVQEITLPNNDITGNFCFPGFYASDFVMARFKRDRGISWKFTFVRNTWSALCEEIA